ncbi:MAG: endolytic transglycosylase MltG [Candidatus Pacebacteria bacterium]|nr:endolytic transglycosylase MltG [Candidatus Paceibacterota bacterium]
MIKKILTFITIIVILAIGFALYLANDFQSSLNAINPNDNNERIFTISDGQRAKEIAASLEKEGLIKNDLYLLIKLYLESKENKIQSGDYILKPAMSAQEIIDTITNGRATAKKLTVIEGWSLKDIAEEAEKMNIAKVQDFYDISGFPATDYRERVDKPQTFYSEKDFPFLKDKPTWVSIEGYLYPDTYYLPISAKPETIIKKALSNFDKKLTPELREEIKKQGKTIFEIVTMASVLEKEVKTLDDKKTVAGILYKRMEMNMPLQVDATTLYSQIKDVGADIDTKYNSPYNTYVTRGLPLGPICSPTIESIEAAVYPTKSNFLFYLSAKKDGKTIFSKTFEEHKKAILNHL